MNMGEGREGTSGNGAENAERARLALDSKKSSSQRVN